MRGRGTLTGIRNGLTSALQKKKKRHRLAASRGGKRRRPRTLPARAENARTGVIAMTDHEDYRAALRQVIAFLERVVGD